MRNDNVAELLDYHYKGSEKDNLNRRLSSLFLKLGPRKTGGLVLTLLVMLALPITLIALQQRQNIKQRAAEGECMASVLDPTGVAGTDPLTNQFYKPSAIVMEPNHRVYVFLIGDGGPQSGKPMGDWYNLYVIDGDIHNGSISWTDYGGTIFRNMGGILSSTVRTYRDGQGIHVYVNGLDTATNTPRGEYMSIIEVNNNIIPWTDQLDGKQGNANQSSTVTSGGYTFKFLTDGGPLSGCLTQMQEGVIGGRNGIIDRPDETNANQFKVLYVIPKDGTDHEYDLNGAIERSIKEQQKWLADKTNGYQVRFDTYDGGKLDIGFVRLALTGNDVIGYSPSEYSGAHGRIQSNLEVLGFRTGEKPNKRYAVYYDGDSQYACGDSFSPGTQGIIYLQGHNYSNNLLCPGLFPLNGLPSIQKSAETLLLHEMFHTIGAVDEHAPHAGGAHISRPDGTESESDIATDLLYSGSRGLNPSAVDVHHDDYFLLSNSELRDVAKSGFLYNDTNLARPLCEPFSDICDYGEETKKAIACLSTQFGVVRGYSDGRFGGSDTIIRGTYVAFLVRYRRDVLKLQDWIDDYNTIDSYYDNLPEANSGAPFGQKKFSDIDKSNPLWKEIYLSQKKGFILGYQDGEFKPNEKWFFGFHGITRDDTFRGVGYNFQGPSDADQRGITRASFITNLYQYSLDRNRDKLTGCSL